MNGGTKILLFLAAVISFGPQSARAMLESTDHSAPPAGWREAYGLTPDKESTTYAVAQVSCDLPANVVGPSDRRVSFSFQITNLTDHPIHEAGKAELIRYELRTTPPDMFSYELRALDTFPINAAISLDLAAHGRQTIELPVEVPEIFGGYALILDFGSQGRRLATLFVRALTPAPSAGEFPVMTLDERDHALLRRLGIRSVRKSVDYRRSDAPDFNYRWDHLKKEMDDLTRDGMTCMLYFQGNPPDQTALGVWAHQLDDENRMVGWANDSMWRPDLDPDFSLFVQRVCREFGYPHGPVTAVYLYNEPWEGGGISGWLADMLRYREAYRAMARGVLAARKAANVTVLVGGCDSSFNAMNKLFADPSGRAEFLPVFDFVSIHYQGLNCPSTVPLWRDRQAPQPYGRVRVWDTESWVANTDDRILPLLSSWRAAGYDRVMGVDANMVMEDRGTADIAEPDGAIHKIPQQFPGSPAAALAAVAHFLGDRPFHEILFKNGLPWVFVFDGLPGPDGTPGNPEDGTVVITGDILAGDGTILRSVHPLPHNSHGAMLTLPVDPAYAAYDAYGNPVAPSADGRLFIPLTTRSYVLRGDGKPGSFAKLIAAVRAARIDGLEPVEIVAHDMTAPLASRPAVHLRLTNVLNRPVTGILSVTLSGVAIGPPNDTLTLAPRVATDVALSVNGVAEISSNTYKLIVIFDAGADGAVHHEEDLHCNVIARRSVKIDGDLSDWEGVLPQPVTANDGGPSLTEQAWYPNRMFARDIKAGFATGYLAYDSTNFYFAAKIADTTPDLGTLRFATRDDDAFFFPPTVFIPPDTTAAPPQFSARWSAALTASTTGRYTLVTHSDDGVRVFVNGVCVIDDWSIHAPAVDRAAVDLVAGRAYDLRIEYFQDGGGALLKAGWIMPGATKETPIPLEALIPAGPVPAGAAAHGVTVQFFRNKDLTGLAQTRVDSVIGTDAFSGDVASPTFGEPRPWRELHWPAGVRRYVYAHQPVLPAGNGSDSFDNVQIAFNVTSENDVAAKDSYPCLPGTVPGYTPTPENDYEFALNAVAARYGGGTEVWRLKVPGQPLKDFYPRQPADPHDGPVPGAQLVVRRDAVTRIVECAIPWTELPLVKERLDEGQTIKFNFRVNDNDGPSYELAHDRSVSRIGSSMHSQWITHWRNEIEFGFEGQ